MNEIKIDYKNDKGFTHKILDVMDIDYENIIQYFGECLNFINGDAKVFVHCAAGESRSATIVIAYLMYKNKMSYEEAYDFIKNKRNVINPNSGFQEQLKKFEKILKENN